MTDSQRRLNRVSLTVCDGAKHSQTVYYGKNDGARQSRTQSVTVSDTLRASTTVLDRLVDSL
ncbi:hypothetical protein DPMN_028562 [Dreissena polymorpha]|uniref:Uncharacterized protein n=1 Tax=Dreissena polymorpha TaxID=45954 RepID=A0A9D4LUY0_DREPO|nr:hypothetical protein DPMN_028562 [Dreissena polymorpha]